MRKDLVIWFEDLKRTDIPSVGGKNANLGEMIGAGIPVPPGFAITAYSYKRFIEETKISEKIYEIIETIADPNDPKLYKPASRAGFMAVVTSHQNLLICSIVGVAYRILRPSSNFITEKMDTPVVFPLLRPARHTLRFAGEYMKSACFSCGSFRLISIFI